MIIIFVYCTAVDESFDLVYGCVSFFVDGLDYLLYCFLSDQTVIFPDIEGELGVKGIDYDAFMFIFFHNGSQIILFFFFFGFFYCFFLRN